MSVNFDKFPKAKIFDAHGVDFDGMQGQELVGTCPFTGKPKKFYVNSKTWLWDSKTAGLSGNIAGFLEEIHKTYEEDLTKPELEDLAKHRKLPPGAFTPWHVGWTGDKYTVPVRDAQGKMQDIRMYHLGKKQMRSTAGCNVGLLGAELLGADLTSPVYICEGEWDAMAMRWLLKKVDANGLVVAVPGAGIFKKEWAPWFNGRRVTVLFDHDEPGRKGEQGVFQKLSASAKQLLFTHWPEDLPTGFDVRDWITYGIRKGTLDKCLERMSFLFKKQPRRAGNMKTQTETGQVIRLVQKRDDPAVAKKPRRRGTTLDDVHTMYRKWLYLPSTDAIDVMLATTISQQMDGPPVWMFMVSPPGGAKTITLAGLNDYEHGYSTSSLTAHALISGANFSGTTDPSLIPRLNGKVLIIKDFTSILGLRDNEKEEIFSILRDAYDGKCGKIFGNGVERNYDSHFTIIAAVTPRIYDLSDSHAALGERFLKYVMGDNLHHENEVDIISKAIENVDQDSTIREELTSVTSSFLEGLNLETVRLPSDIHKRIIALAQLGARLRGTVSRNLYNADMMTGRPFAEVGSRLGIQLSKVARALAGVHGRSEVTSDEYRIVRKIMLDTVSQRSEDIVRTIYRTGKDKWLSVQDIATVTRYPTTTIRRIMDDLNLLKVVQRKPSKDRFHHAWALSDYILNCIRESGVYIGETGEARLLIKRRRPGAGGPVPGAGPGAGPGGRGPGGRKPA